MRKLFILLFFCLFACQPTEIKFDRTKWDKCVDGFCDYRESMVKDLMINHLKKGMSINQLQKLLGEPDFYAESNKNKIGYDIFVDYGSDIDPIETKTLEFELKDSIVVNFKLQHLKN